MDLRAAVLEDAPLTLKPGVRDAVPTGLIMEIPAGFEGQVRPRSGLALKYGVTCLNSPGTIDSDYRGEVKVILANLGSQDFVITRGMRIAQLVIAPVTRVEIVEIEEASDTQRGTGGFGSTGSH
jgi:dUTP pyrophosphatase